MKEERHNHIKVDRKRVWKGTSHRKGGTSKKQLKAKVMKVKVIAPSSKIIAPSKWTAYQLLFRLVPLLLQLTLVHVVLDSFAMCVCVWGG